jgi:hypothetical protein
VIPVVPLSSSDDVDVLLVVDVVVVLDPVWAVAEWVTPVITVAVRATPATATAPPTRPARRRRRSEDEFSVMTITMRPGASRPSHHSVKRSLRPLRCCQCRACHRVPTWPNTRR